MLFDGVVSIGGSLGGLFLVMGSIRMIFRCSSILFGYSRYSNCFVCSWILGCWMTCFCARFIWLRIMLVFLIWNVKIGWDGIFVLSNCSSGTSRLLSV